MDIDLITVRTYYADIGKFLNQDRFKDKYPSMSPYQYAALNPISFINVNGDSVDVNRLYETDEDGNLINPNEVLAFELFASTDAGREYILDRAHKDFN